MAKVEVKRTLPVEPKVESVTLTLSVEEAFYVIANLSGANANVHGVSAEQLGIRYDNEVFASLTYALAEALPRSEYRRLYDRHVEIATTLRPDYNYSEALKVSKKYGIASS